MKVDKLQLADTLILRAIPEFITLAQAKDLYGLSRTTLYRLRYDRKIFHYSLGDKTFVRVSELNELIEAGKK
jgi:hypothetical protein